MIGDFRRTETSRLSPVAEAAFKAYHDSAAELTKHYGTPIGVEAQQRQSEEITKFHHALNDPMKILVARLGISERD
jgi:hypothetical protein